MRADHYESNIRDDLNISSCYKNWVDLCVIKMGSIFMSHYKNQADFCTKEINRIDFCFLDP